MTKAELIEYVKSDLYRNSGDISLKSFLFHITRNSGFIYTFWLRLTRSENAIVRVIAILFHRHLSRKYLLQIPRSCQIGKGLYLGHHMCIVISSEVTIGDNCNLSQFTTIGANVPGGARIGDGVYIGPSVCIVGGVRIGDDATIGAGSVVVKDIRAGATAVGVPATVINTEPKQYVKNQWPRKTIELARV